jgi:hypothetical protein
MSLRASVRNACATTLVPVPVVLVPLSVSAVTMLVLYAGLVGWLIDL